jgi:hypothetical protein
MSKRIRNYRTGDRAEDLGVFLLRAFCAVAPIPRPDVKRQGVGTTAAPRSRDHLRRGHGPFEVLCATAWDRRVVEGLGFARSGAECGSQTWNHPAGAPVPHAPAEGRGFCFLR